MSHEVIPFFSAQKDIEVIKQIDQKFADPKLSYSAKLKRLSGNFKFQAWEITDIPISDTFYYTKKETGGITKLIHESDEGESEIDILDATSDLIRNGWEKEAVRRWRQALMVAPPGSKVIQINPKKDPTEDPATCNYKKTQINYAEVLAGGRIKVYQVQSSLDTAQSAQAFNKLTSQTSLSPDHNVKEVIQTIGLTDRSLTPQQVLEIISQISGERFDSLNQILNSKSHIQKMSYFAAIRYLQAIEQGLTGLDLEQLHAECLMSVLPYSFLASRITFSPSSQFSFETSCGPINLRTDSRPFGQGVLSSLFSENKWAYHQGDCLKCEQKNTQVGPCDICKDCEKKLA